MRAEIFCTAALLALAPAPGGAEPLTVGIELQIADPVLKKPWDPADQGLLLAKLREGLVRKLGSRLIDWDFVPNSDARYQVVFRVFEFVPGEPPELRIALRVLDRGKAVIPERQTVWRKVGEHHGFEPPEQLAEAMLSGLNTLVEPAGLVTSFRQHVAIGSGAVWGRSPVMTLELTQKRHGRLATSRFLVDSRPNSCQLQSNGTGFFPPCSKGKILCLQAKAVCCIFHGLQQVPAPNVPDLLQYHLGDIFLSDDLDNELSLYDPEGCR